MKKIIFVLLFILVTLAGCDKTTSNSVPGKISGIISVSPQLAAKLKPTDVLYIIARAQQMGPPSAVKRVEKPQFPLKYMIGAEDSMMPGMGGFEKDSNLTLAARISRTGNAMPAQGDLEGVYPKNPSHPGSGGVDIVIDRERD